MKSTQKWITGIAHTVLVLAMALCLAGCSDGGTNSENSEQSTTDTTVASYTVTFKANGGTGSDYTQTFTAGTAQALTTNPFTRTGYTFAGWASTSDATSATYTDSQSVTMTADTTLYALWTSVSYTVTYVNNESDTTGAVPTDSNTYTIDSTVTVLGNTGSLRVSGKVVCGWSTQSGASTAEYTTGSTFTMGSANVTLYAVWQTVAIGDIICSDGSVYTAATIASSGKTGVAVIFMTTPRVLGVALTETSTGLAWALSGTTGASLKVSAIEGTAMGQTYTGDTDGSDNWAAICSADSTAAANPTNYPAFNYTESYSALGYTSGWYLPAGYELYKLLTSFTTVNASLAACSGSSLTDNFYLSSTAESGAATYIIDVAYSSDFGYGCCCYSSKEGTDIDSTRAIRAF